MIFENAVDAILGMIMMGVIMMALPRRDRVEIRGKCHAYHPR